MEALTFNPHETLFALTSVNLYNINLEILLSSKPGYTMATKSIFPFLSLPRELRDMVYRFALSFQENKTTNIDGYTSYSIIPAWLWINRQIHQEAAAVFRKNIFVAISTPWPRAFEHIESQGFVPVLAVGKAGETFKGYHLDVQISSPHIDEAHTFLERFIILLDDLKTFCDFWFYQDLDHPGLNTHLELTLVIKDPHSPEWDSRIVPKALQRQFLEPFGVVKSLHGIKVNGEHYATIAKSMREMMETPAKSPEECFEEAIRLKDEGNVLLQNKQYREAIKKYEESFHAIHILVQGRRRSVWADAYFHAELRSGPRKGQFGHIVRIILRFELVANTILAYFRLGEYEEARFWGMRTINLMGDVSPEEPLDFPAGKAIGHIYLRTAWACRELGKKGEALQFFRIAVGYLPSERQAIDSEIRSTLI